MKITVELTQLHAAPHLGRVAAVAILSALPDDEARLAMQQWAACREALDGAETAATTADEPPAAAAPSFGSPSLSTPEAEQVLDSPKPLPDERKLKPSALSPGTPLTDCLSAKAANALGRAGFQVLGDLEACSADWLMSTVDRFGKGALAEVEAAMARAGLSLEPGGGVPQHEAAPAEPEVTPEVEPEAVERAGPPTPRVVEDIADTLSFDLTETAAAPAPAPQTNGSGDLDGLSLRALCKRAEHEVGRDKVMAALASHGVQKLAEVTDEQAVRASILGLMT